MVDLLLALTTEAATHARANVILNPFPLVIDPTTKMKILNPNQPDYNLCSTIAEALPSMQQLVSSEDAGKISKYQKIEMRERASRIYGKARVDFSIFYYFFLPSNQFHYHFHVVPQF